MACKRVVAGLVLLLLAAGVVGCSRVQDPWVPSSSYLKQERERPAQLADHLRQRVMETQIDR